MLGVSLEASALPPIPASHPRILLTGSELQRLRDDLAAGRPAIQRFKQQVVDAQIAGADIYGYEAWYSALMGVVTGQPQYCAHAIQMTDAFLDDEALLIHNGDYPDARSDSYLNIGGDVGGVALVYDWCYANLTPVQKLRWGNYADRFTDNVWNQATNHWGEPTPQNNYSWEGTAQPPGSGWSVDNPVDNYYYSFLRATMLWGLASYNEPGRVMADGFLQKFRYEKIQNQLVPVFNAQVSGGGSREGTGYGTAMGALFALYHLWEKTTGERIADLTPHTAATIPYMIHVIAPTRDRLAPIGDHSRDETAAFYDYHRAEILALATLFRGTPLARSARDFLAASSLPMMGDRFNWVNDVLYDGVETGPPAALSTTYLATGTGHFFTRSSWDPSATWLTFLAGAYTESHAHPDGLSILLYKNGWLVNDANMETHSGLAQMQEAHALVTQRRVSDGRLLDMFEYSADGAVPESSVRLRALAVKPDYTYVSADSGTLFVDSSGHDKGIRASRDIVYLKPDTVIVFDRAEYTLGASTKTFQLPTEGRPTIAGRVATYSNATSTLRVHAVSPVASALSITDMRGVDPDFHDGFRIDDSVTSSGPTQFLHVLSIDGSVLRADRGADDGTVSVTLADGRRVTVAFHRGGEWPASQPGTIEIRSPENQVLVSEPLPSTIVVPALLATPTSPAGSADLGIRQVAGPSVVGAGKDVAFTLSVDNAGPAAASGVTISNPIPAGMQFVWSSPGCAAAAGSVTCVLGQVPAGGSAHRTVVLRPMAAGVFTNTASVTASQADPVGPNGSSSISVTANSAPAAAAVVRYRLYSPVTLEHHFTTDLNEYTVLGSYVGTWVQEGTVGKVLNGPGSFNGVNAVPYYRLYDTSTRWHHWTTDTNEYYTLAQIPSWNAEGVDGYILPTQAAGSIQLYRLNYPGLGSLHHWTIDANEYNTLITPAYGWNGEGGSGFVIQ